MSNVQAGMLSMVGTPIGNLDDVSPRVLSTLQKADLLLCEDTRVTAKLLARFDIRVPLMRCDENVIESRVGMVVERIKEGQRIAFVSDAGMPGVSDPGQRLVDAALEQGLPIEVIPGPSAVICALVASGLPMEHFFFEGFLPRKQGARNQRLNELIAVPGALVFYESPHRVVATVSTIAKVMPMRRVALIRELTKLHEEVVRDVAPVLAQKLAQREQIRGECVVVVEGPVKGEMAAVASMGSLDDEIRAGLEAGESKTHLAKRLSKQFSQPRADVYNRIVERA